VVERHRLRWRAIPASPPLLVSTSTWVKVRRCVSRGMDPPPNVPNPDQIIQTRLLQHLQTLILSVRCRNCDSLSCVNAVAITHASSRSSGVARRAKMRLIVETKWHQLPSSLWNLPERAMCIICRQTKYCLSSYAVAFSLFIFISAYAPPPSLNSISLLMCELRRLHRVGTSTIMSVTALDVDNVSHLHLTQRKRAVVLGLCSKSHHGSSSSQLTMMPRLLSTA